MQAFRAILATCVCLGPAVALLYAQAPGDSSQLRWREPVAPTLTAPQEPTTTTTERQAATETALTDEPFVPPPPLPAPPAPLSPETTADLHASDATDSPPASASQPAFAPPANDTSAFAERRDAPATPTPRDPLLPEADAVPVDHWRTSTPDSSDSSLPTLGEWLTHTHVGYDNGFVVASEKSLDLYTGSIPFKLRLNGWGQLRHTLLENENVEGDETNLDLNQFQLKRARLTFNGSAFTPSFKYFFQLDGRSSSGDNLRLLDYLLTYDMGEELWGLAPGTFGFKTGKYKMPFTLARSLSGKQFEFTDRSMSSIFFDVNRSLGCGFFGRLHSWPAPLHWEAAVFNGLVTGGAETGSSGTLDDNFAFSTRLRWFPTGTWGKGSLADFDFHRHLATRIGLGFANSTIERDGETEFSRVRVVDSGRPLEELLPGTVTTYTVNLASVDFSTKYRGYSTTFEYYFRSIGRFDDPSIPDLFDHGYWLQVAKFIVPAKLQLLTRWSRVTGDSGTLGLTEHSADELSAGLVYYFREQHSKFTIDLTRLDGAPIDSQNLDIAPGNRGWLLRSQVQFAF